MAVFRVNKNKNFTVMSNCHLHDKRLTLRARGLLSVILSLPDNWDYSKRGLLKLINESEFVLDGVLNELKECKYLQIEKHMPTDGNNRYSYVYNIFENPLQDPNFQGVEFQGVENQDLDFQGVENHPLNKVRNQSKTKEINTKEQNTKTHKSDIGTIIEEYTKNEELKATLGEFMQFRKSIKKPMTEHALQLLIGKLSKMARTDEEKIEILNQSILNGWQGVYPLERSRDGRTRADAYKGHSTGEYKPVGSGETVV